MLLDLCIGLHVHLSTWLGDADKSRLPSLVSFSLAYTLPLFLPNHKHTHNFISSQQTFVTSVWLLLSTKGMGSRSESEIITLNRTIYCLHKTFIIYKKQTWSCKIKLEYLNSIVSIITYINIAISARSDAIRSTKIPLLLAMLSK